MTQKFFPVKHEFFLTIYTPEHSQKINDFVWLQIRSVKLTYIITCPLGARGVSVYAFVVYLKYNVGSLGGMPTQLTNRKRERH